MNYTPDDIARIVQNAEDCIHQSTLSRTSTSKADIQEAQVLLRQAKGTLRDLKLYFTAQRQEQARNEKKIMNLIEKIDDEEKNAREAFFALRDQLQ